MLGCPAGSAADAETRARGAARDALGHPGRAALLAPARRRSTTPRRWAIPAPIPYTRGPYGSMHRGQLWTMRMFAGFGTATRRTSAFATCSRRARPGLSTAFDMPTLMGYDSDADRSLGEVGARAWRSTRWPTWRPVRGHPAGRGHGVDDRQRAGGHGARHVRLRSASGAVSRSTALGGTIQTDILKEFIARRSGSSRRSRRSASSST